LSLRLKYKKGDLNHVKMNKKVPRCKWGLKKPQLQTQSYNEWTTLTLQRTGY